MLTRYQMGIPRVRRELAEHYCKELEVEVIFQHIGSVAAFFILGLKHLKVPWFFDSYRQVMYRFFSCTLVAARVLAWVESGTG